MNGLDYAVKLGWFNYKTFNISEYEHYEQVDNGYLNWIIPGKFMALGSPYENKQDEFGALSPKDYVPIFKKLNVSMVIRLNNKTYDANSFIKESIKHHDLYFTDGTAPNMEIVEKFLEIVEK